MFRIAAIALSAVLLVAVAPLSGQSLADVAKREEDRRKTVKPSGRTITNRDLQSVPPATAAPAPVADLAGSPTGSQPDSSASAAGSERAADTAKDEVRAPATEEKAWRDRMTRLKTQLDRDRIFAEALQTRINALTTDFVNRDDPAQRAVIGADRQKSIDELNRLKKAVVEGTKAIADLEDEARRAGVPAGWLR